MEIVHVEHEIALRAFGIVPDRTMTRGFTRAR
jgi:hypothetical protein